METTDKTAEIKMFLNIMKKRVLGVRINQRFWPYSRGSKKIRYNLIL